MIDEDGNFAISILAVFAVVVIAVMVTTIPQETWTDLGQAITTTATGIVETVTSAIANITTKKQTTTNIQTTTKTTTKNKNKEKDNYWEANLVNGNVIVGKPIS